MKVRIFGASDCIDCLNALCLIKKSGIPLEYVDIDDMDLRIQSFCDENKVDKIPHIQFLSDKEDVIIEHVGSVTPDQFSQYIIDCLPGN